MNRAVVVVVVVAVVAAAVGGGVAYNLRHDEALREARVAALAALDAEESALRARESKAQDQLAELTREERALKSSIEVLQGVIADLKRSAADAARQEAGEDVALDDDAADAGVAAADAGTAVDAGTP